MIDKEPEMKIEIEEDQTWWLKGFDKKYGSWGGLYIVQKLKDGRFYVVEYTEPITRRVLNEYDIRHGWYLP